jgi:hypothetical protein
MKTFFIELDGMTLDNNRDLLGFILTVGLKFRKIESIGEFLIAKTLVVETETLTESRALNEFFTKRGMISPIIISAQNKATKSGKTIGNLKLLGDKANASSYYLDKTTGKKLVIV